MLYRLKDLIPQNRICFLIKILIDFYLLLPENQHRFLVHKDILNPLLLITYFCDSQQVIRYILQFLKPLTQMIDFDLLDNIDQLKFIYYKLNNLEEIIK